MSTDTPTTTRDRGLSGVTPTTDTRFPEPRAHGAGLQNVFNDLPPSVTDKRGLERGTLYDHAVHYWREHVGDHEHEPFVAVEDFRADWLPNDGHRYALVLTSSRWMAGVGRGDDYSAFYEHHLKLRKVVETDDEEPVLKKGPLALHIEIMPQFADLVYKSGDPLECPHGEGTRIVTSTTWAESPEAIEERAHDALAAVYGDVFDPADVNPESRKIQKAEAHVRHDISTKNAVIDTIEDSKQLVAYGGESEIDSYARRSQEGWVEARVSSDRWDLLGFANQRFETEVKCYQRSDWADRPADDPAHHPKLEASFNGVKRGALPHADEWDSVMRHLRTVVATHAYWAGVERSDLVADDFFLGAAAPEFAHERPTGRREMLRQRYEERATDIYREALKPHTTAVYDLLLVVARENGATYDTLVRETGLARSTVRYHVARLDESGVLERRGNPVLVVFDSMALLDRAREILKEVNPGDDARELEERADERRDDRRERQEANDAGVRDERDDHGEHDDRGDADDELGFRYLAHLKAKIGDVSVLYDRGDLSDHDVRVRADELPPDLR